MQGTELCIEYDHCSVELAYKIGQKEKEVSWEEQRDV